MKSYLRSFAGGEVTPELFGRIDDIRFQTGLALAKNFVTLPHGPAKNRPGSMQIIVSGTTGSPTAPPRLIAFKQYFRFFVNKAPVMHPTGGGAPNWSNGTDYTVGQFVTYVPDGRIYQALQASGPSGVGAKQPDTNPLFWHKQPLSGQYEVEHPFTGAQLPFVRYWQSNDIITLAHRDVPTRELRRYGATDWRVVIVAPTPTLPTPGSQVAALGSAGMTTITDATVAAGTTLRLRVIGPVTWINGESIYGSVVFVTPNFTLGPRFFRAVNPSGSTFDLLEVDGTNPTGWGASTFSSGSFQAVPSSSERINNYRVTAVDADGNESQPPIPATATRDNNLNAEGAYNTITWTAVTGAVRYRVYKKLSGAYGLIGVTEGLTFKDDNITPEIDKGHSILDTTLTVSPYPEAGCYHEQRRVFAVDQLLRMTRSGTEIDMSYHIPVLDDDRISFPIASNEFSPIQHCVSMNELILLTSAVEYVVNSPDAAVLTPSSIALRPASFVGSSHVRPVLVNNTLLFCAARGGHLRDLTYRVTAQGYVPGDLSLRAAHLFDNLTIVDLTFAKAPYPIAWAVSSNGKLLGLTDVPDQEVLGWHQHTLGDSDAIVESCLAVTEGNEDTLYLIVRRTVNGSSVRYIEALTPFAFGAAADWFFVDCGKTVTGSFTAGVQIGGFSHLIGKTVSILANGIVLPQQVVNSSGEIKNTLGAIITKVTAGLPIDAQLQTLPIALQIDGFAQAQPKAVSNVYVRVANSAPFRLGPALTDMAPSDAAAASIRGLLAVETLRTERVPVLSPPAWSADGQVFIKHTTPLPLTVVGVTLEVVLGGD
jgi:hypothetical protein